MADGKEWQASAARANLAEVMRRALSGEPQVIRHRSGEEVVMVSRKDFEKRPPGGKAFLLRGGRLEDGDELEAAIARNRADGIGIMGSAASRGD